MKSVLVLGANADIAKALSHKFASEGFNIILAARDLVRLEVVRRDIAIKYNVNTQVEYFDALDYESHNRFYAGLNIVPDVTVCVFGYLGDQKAGEKEWHEAHKILQTNFMGAVSILNIVGNDYEERKMGCIIGISSVAGERGRQSNYLYGSAKAGFSIYLGGLRNRLSKANVQVISVKPGFVATKMTEDLDLPKLLTASPTQVANKVFSSYEKRKNIIYVLPVWRWIMLIIKIIPESIFKKMNL